MNAPLAVGWLRRPLVTGPTTALPFPFLWGRSGLVAQFAGPKSTTPPAWPSEGTAIENLVDLVNAGRS